MPPASVVVSQVHSVRQYSSETFIGTITPIRKSVVGSAFGGRVVDVLIEEGQRVGVGVEKSEFDDVPLGEPIIQLRTTTLDMEINAAQSELRLRELAAEELKISIPADIQKAKTDIAEITSRLDFARSVHERHRGLFESSGVSEREMLEAQSAFNSLKELLSSAETMHHKLVSTQQLRLDQAAVEVDNQKAEIRRLMEMRENYTIRAPFEGYVVTRMAELGQWIAPGQAVAEIVQLDPIELVVNVPQRFVSSVQRTLDLSPEKRSQSPVNVSIDSIDQMFIGELVQIVPQADLRSRAFPVKVRLNNPKVNGRHLISAGMLGSASFFVGEEAEILVVKKDALVLGPQIVVYMAAAVTQPDQSTQVVAQPVNVTVGAALGEWIEVKGLLKAGDQVVVKGNERLFPGQPLAIQSEQSDGPPTASGQPNEAATADGGN